MLTVVFFFFVFFLLRHQYCRALSVCAIQEDMAAPMHPRQYISLSYQSASQVHTVRGTKGSEGNLFSARSIPNIFFYTSGDSRRLG